MSLKTALTEGVGGVTISEQELKSVATELLSFDRASSSNVATPLATDETGESSAQENTQILEVRPTRTAQHARRTLLKRRLNPELSSSQPSTSDEVDSFLVSDSGLSSDTSEVLSMASTSGSGMPKRRGGWPKGRKRKPENKFEVRQPKAPATGYVLFLNERRKEYKNLRFTEVCIRIVLLKHILAH